MIPVRGRVPGQWNDSTAQHLTERLQAIERALSGGAQVFSTPASPAYGAGSGAVVTAVAGAVAGTGPGAVGGGVSDHGLLTGLGDNDHPQYSLNEQGIEPPIMHVHGEFDVIGLESRFVTRGEQVDPLPHPHGIADVRGTENEYVRRNEAALAESHRHMLADIADFQLWEMMLWREVYGG
jgi:hypothetical protein